MSDSFNGADRKRRPSPSRSDGHFNRNRVPFGVAGSQKVFFMKEYHPVQAGSIDGTDSAPHDRGIKRAMAIYRHGLYDPNNDEKMIGDPNLTLFIGNLSPLTVETELREALEHFGGVRNIRLVRDIVTGASRRYAFVEFETYRGMWRAYREKEIILQGAKLLVEWNRQRLMPGWIPRRYGGGIGGMKTSGQLRFGGRARHFRAPLREIPAEELRRKGMCVPDKRDFQSAWELPPLPESVVDGIHRERRELEMEERGARENEGRERDEAISERR